MGYTKDNILDGETPYKVLRQLRTDENGSYSTEIAKELGIKQPTVSDILSLLEDRNLIQKGKRTRAQYYKPDYRGIYDLHLELMYQMLKVCRTSDFSSEDREDFFSSLTYHDDPKMERAFEEYIKGYLEERKASSIHSMIVTDFLNGFAALDQINDGSMHASWFQNRGYADLYREIYEQTNASTARDQIFLAEFSQSEEHKDALEDMLGQINLAELSQSEELKDALEDILGLIKLHNEANEPK